MPGHVLEAFAQTLPRRPYCTDEKGTGIFRLPAKHAAGMRYVQPNPTAFVNWLAFDIDGSGPDLQWRNVPTPNIIIRNPNNPKAHVLYRLAAPVARTDAARHKPLRYLAAVNEGLRHALGADRGYAGLICKNPLHPSWRVEIGTGLAYDLSHLADFCDLKAAQRRLRASPRREQIGLGRNCTLFDEGRHWAYKWVQDYRSRHSFERWQAVMRDRIEEMNSFAEPLPEAEVKSIARSIAKWTWHFYNGERKGPPLPPEGMTPEVFSLVQSNLGKMGLRARWGDNTDKRAQAIELRAAGMTQKEIAAALGVTSRTIIRWLK